MAKINQKRVRLTAALGSQIKLIVSHFHFVDSYLHVVSLGFNLEMTQFIWAGNIRTPRTRAMTLTGSVMRCNVLEFTAQQYLYLKMYYCIMQSMYFLLTNEFGSEIDWSLLCCPAPDRLIRVAVHSRKCVCLILSLECHGNP